MTGMVAGHRASWWGVAMASLALAVVFAAAMPLGAHAASLGSQDASYGNVQPTPYAALYGPGEAAYNPGNLVALPNGESLVADGSVLGVTKLTEEGGPNSTFGNFGTSGVKLGTAVVGNPDEANGESSASAVAVAPNGDYVVAGASWPTVGGKTNTRPGTSPTAGDRTVGAGSTLAVAEFTSAGKLDTSFASAGETPGVLQYQTPVGEPPPTSTAATDVAVQSGGIILVVGTEHIGSPSEPAVLVDRIPSEGGGQELFSLQVEGQPTEGDAITEGPDGTIYVAATENPGTTHAKVVVARLVETAVRFGPSLEADATRRELEPSFAKSTIHLELDPSFDAGAATPGELTSTLGGPDADVDALAVTPSGDVLIGGQVGTGTSSVAVVASITPSGSLNNEFGLGGVATLNGREGFQMSLVSAIVAQPSGASVIAGDDFATGTGCGICEARLGVPGAVHRPDALASEGRNGHLAFVAELTANGVLDTGFDATGTVPGVTFTDARHGAQRPGQFLPSGYETLAVTGLGIDQQGRVLLAAEEEDAPQPSVPNDGSVERFFGYVQPTAEFTFPAAIHPDQRIALDGSASSDPTGSISDYLWTFEPPDAVSSIESLTRSATSASRDGGSTPRLDAEFGSPGNVHVTLQVTNPAGQTSTVSHSVPVLPAPASGLPAASVSPESLSFHETLEEYDWLGYSYSEAEPQKVFVTNVGGAPLSISAVKVVNSAGAFAKEPDDAVEVGEGSGAKGLSEHLNETCAGATLAPGGKCYVTVVYGNAGVYPKATGELEIESNSPTSPDFVSLTGSAQSPPPNPGRPGCPTEIGSNGFSISPPGLSALGEPLGPGLQACWNDLAAGSPNPVGDTFGTPGPVLIDKGVALWPTSPNDLLTVSPAGPHDATDTISASPLKARYLLQTTTVSGGLPDQPLGIVEPGEHPFVCQATSRASTHSSINAKTPFQAQSPYGGCGEALLDFTSDTPADTVHGLAVKGGSVKLTVCGADTTAYAELPGGEPARGKVGFRVSGARGASPATATLHYGPFQEFLQGGCGQSTYPGEGVELGAGEGSAPEFSCPGTAKVTPNCSGKEFNPAHIPPGSGSGEQGQSPGNQNSNGEPHKRGLRAPGPASVAGAREGEAGASRAHKSDVADTPRAHESDASSSESGVCPAGDEDYSESVPQSFVGAMKFSDAYLCYDPSAGVWTTGGKADLAELTGGIINGSIKTGPAPEYGFSFRSNGEFVRGGIEEVGFNPGIPIGGVVELDSFGGRFATDPTFVQAHATIGVAHLLSIKGSAFAVWANPSYPYTYHPEDIVGVEELQTNTHEHPFEDFAAGAGGEVSLTPPGIGSITLGQAYGLYAAPSYFEFGGCLGTCKDGLSLLGIATVKAYVKGALDTGDGEYDIEGGIEACAHFPWPFESICGKGNGVASNKGMGGCVDLEIATAKAGGGVSWVYGHGPRVFLGCHLGEVEVSVQRSGARASASDAGAHSAQAGGAVSLSVTGHHPATDIWVKGAGGSPLLALSGPHGAQLSETSAGDAVHAVLGKSVLTITPEPSVDETLVAITDPAPGTWTLTPLPGSPAVSKVEHANALAPAKISASVSGRGGSRMLSYRVPPRAGEKVTFVEHGPEVFHVLGKASAKHGRIRFSPASGPGGERKIEALLTLAGVPQPAIVLGSYTAPAPAQAARPPHLRLSRRGDQLKISWGRARNAAHYLAVVTLSNGQVASYEEPARTRVTTVPLVGSAVSGHVQVSGVSLTGATGPPASATLQPVSAPRGLRGLKLTRARGEVVVTWKRSRGAKVYAVRLQASGGPAYTTAYLTTPRFMVSKVLPGVPAGRLATVSVTAINAGGAGPAGHVSYHAG